MSKPQTADRTPSVSEMLTELEKWYKQRADQLNPAHTGRDLRDQRDLLNAVTGTEEDITFLLRLNKSILDTMRTKDVK